MGIKITVNEAIEKFGLIPVTANKIPYDSLITGVYIGDLLSWVMGKAKEGCAWLTIQSHVNIVAVAMLVNAACIIVCEGSQVDPDTIEKADNEDIIILTTALTSYELAEKFALYKE